MPSDDPRPERCAAQVVDKVGIEIHADDFSVPDDELPSFVLESDEDDYQHVLTDDHIDVVEITHSDGYEKHQDPEYDDVVHNLRDGFNTEALQTEGDRIVVEDEDPYVTNRGTALDGYCERFPMDNGRCYVHGGNNRNKEGNTNAMTHGLYAQRSNYYQALDADDQAYIEEMVDSWIDNAPFDKDNVAKVNRIYKIAIDEHKLWRTNDYFADEGLITEDTVDIDGEQVVLEDEHPANLVYDRMSRTSLRELKELGCLDDPDSDQAEATKSIVEMLSGSGE